MRKIIELELKGDELLFCDSCKNCIVCTSGKAVITQELTKVGQLQRVRCGACHKKYERATK